MGGTVWRLSEGVMVGSGVLVTMGYHAYLGYHLRRKPGLTTIGIHSIKTTTWLRQLNQGDDKKGMLAVQSLRNSLMSSILTALVTTMIVLSLGALINNVYTFDAAAFIHFNHHHHHLRLRPIIIILSIASWNWNAITIITVIKYGSALVFLLTSFFSCGMGISYLIDANFLVNAIGDFGLPRSLCLRHTETILERGFRLVTLGNRLLCISFPFLCWMFGPLPMLFSSLALVSLLYQLDFPAAAAINGRPPNPVMN